MTEFISRNYGQEKFEVIIKTDNKEHYKSAENFARKLIDHAKPQTNADRIRAMSDMELRDFLQSRIWICETHELCNECPLYNEEKGCLSTLEWLQQPAEVDKDA